MIPALLLLGLLAAPAPRGYRPDVTGGGRVLAALALDPSARDAALDALQAEGVGVDTPDQDGILPLTRVIWRGEYAAAEALLARGASLERAGGVALCTYAVENGDPEILDWLLAHGVPLNAPGAEDAPLAAAVRMERLELGRSVLARGGDARWADPTGLTLVHRSLQHPTLPLLHELLAAGADPNRPDPQGRPPLLLAVWTGKPNAVSWLLSAGATMDTDLQRRLAQEAIRWGYAETLAVVLQAAPLPRRPRLVLPPDASDAVRQALSAAGVRTRRGR